MIKDCPGHYLMPRDNLFLLLEYDLLIPTLYVWHFKLEGALANFE